MLLHGAVHLVDGVQGIITQIAQLIAGRCFKAVDLISDEESKLIAIDEETDHEIVHGCRFRKANRAAHEPLAPGPQIDMFALNILRVLLVHLMLLSIEMPLVGSQPSVK